MKKTIIYGFLAALLPMATSCSESFLHLEPQVDVPPTTLFASPDDAQYAINGLGRLMASQYASQGLNGEGTMNLYFGDMPGFAMQKCDYTGWSNTINGKYHANTTNANMAFSWHYNYRMIANANQLLANAPAEADMLPEEKGHWHYVKAQALTYRAFAYLHLVQLYSRRWSDRNGESRGVVLRTEPTTEPKAAASLKEVYQQIYDDLDTAIDWFNTCGYSRGSSNNWLPSEEAAHAIYSRAALNRQDWAKAASEADLAGAKTSVMTAEMYEQGFNTPNQEWIWSAFNDASQDLYYYGFFAYAGSNSKSSNCRSYPPAISRQVVEKINPADSRLKLYAIPTADEMPKHANLVSGSGLVVSTSAANLAKLSGDALENAQQCNAFYNRVKAKGSFIYNRLYSTTKLYYYIATKFQATNDLSVGHLCLIRKAEMLYNAAEAQYMLNNEPAAQALLEEAVAPYQPGYTCTLTGQALLDEILAYREFDLYGEGFSWNDLKRRGATMVRLNWQDGGSWNTSFAGETKPEALNRWTFVYPKIETDFNPLVQTVEDDNWTK